MYTILLTWLSAPSLASPTYFNTTAAAQGREYGLVFCAFLRAQGGSEPTQTPVFRTAEGPSRRAPGYCPQCFATICLLPTAVQARDHEPLLLHQGNLWPSKVRAGSRDPRPSETHACRVITLHLVPHPINRLLSQTPATLHSALKIGQLSTHIRSFKDGFLQTKAPPYQNETRSATIGRFPLVCFTEYTIQFTCLSIIAFFPSSYLH